MNQLHDSIIAYTTRGEAIDCVHYGSVVVIDSVGSILLAIGDAYRPTIQRSVTKPAKLLSFVSSGAMKKLNFDKSHVAIAAGSHSGTKTHIELLREMANRVQVPIDELVCGKTLPLGDDAVVELIENGPNELSMLHNDCSGEHIAQIGLCKHLNLDYSNYYLEEHPVQLLIRNNLTEVTEYDHIASIALIDGCGLPTYQIPLYNIAKMMSNVFYLNNTKKSNEIIFGAIREYPYLYGGKSRFVTHLIDITSGKVIGKDGAEGLFALTWPNKGISLAIKIGDGNHRAAVPVIFQIMRKLDLLPKDEIAELERQIPSDVYTHNGLKIAGKILAAQF